MTLFAACLFAVAALASIGAVLSSWQRYGPGALALRSQRKACPETAAIVWKSVERVHMPALAPLRMARAERPDRRKMPAPVLEWPAVIAA